MTATLRAFRLCGHAAADALDWLHVHADVRGAIEDEQGITVWLPGPLPPLPQPGVGIVELSTADANRSATGLEGDAPIAVSDDLLVRPPWVAPPADFTGIELVVPRGMAFGSGEHASTQAALLCLHAVWPARLDSIADVGTGSGILLLYASVHGVARLLGCDVEAAAVAAARELVPAAVITLGGPDTLPAAADLVVANLTAAELAAALPAMLPRWTRRAPLVLGGMRLAEVDAIAAMLPWPPRHRVQIGGFCAIAFTAT